MDRLDAMSAFVSVAELRGFAPAARKLGVSPSAVTRSVAALEERLGIRLLQRTTRSVTLTDAGVRYLDRARRILIDVEEADAAAQAERTEPTGRFAVSAPLVFGRMKVAPIVCAYLARHPRVIGELILADRMVNLVDEGIDVAVRIGHLADGSVVARKVGETRRVIVAAPSYFAGRKRPKSPRDLADHSIVQCTAVNATSAWAFDGASPAPSISFAPTFLTNSVDAAIGHAELGAGMTMVLAYQVEEAVRAGRLEVVLPKFETAPLPIHLVYATKRHPSANVRTFVETVVATSQWHFVKLPG